MSHTELIEAAAKWLSRRHPVVITEMAHAGGEEADAIGFGLSTTLIECKTSRSDFAADRRKYTRRGHRGFGMAQRRYYMCPEGLLVPGDLPDGWGLLHVTKRGVRIVVEATARQEWDHRGERDLLVSLVRRLGVDKERGVRVRVYRMDDGPAPRAAAYIAPEAP